MSLASGTKLGPYEVLAPLGAGGMGEVYLARDGKLDREVAVKILPDTFARDPERVARFQREAKLLASLNHPNIAAIYGFEESDDKRFLVLELVEGDTLEQRLRAGALPVDEALEVCKQIAEALEAAHERGVIHRDLKPANVKVTPDGVVKVLDFGLAKAFIGDTTGAALADSPTITVEHTRPGVVLGTAAYMSPEQARGKPLDKRTDIWSFGCVLYECLTETRPFAGETTSDTIAKILERDPDFDPLPSNTPFAVRNLLHHCLEKDRQRRLRDIGDALVELDEAISTRAWSTTAMAAAVDAPAYRKPRAGVVISAALWLVLGVGLGAGLWHMVRPSTRPQVSRTSIVLPPELKIIVGRPSPLTKSIRISPDGQTLAFLAQRKEGDAADGGTRMIFTRQIDRYDVRALDGTERVEAFVFSPDGRWLAFVAPVAPDSDKKRLAKVPVDGRSPPLTITAWPTEWSSWMGPQFTWLPGGDIVILIREGDAFTRAPSEGGAPTTPVKIERGPFSGFVCVSSALPGDQTVLLNLLGYGQHGWQTAIAALDVETGKLHVLVPDSANGTYAATGHLLFSRGETLLGAPFDVDRLELTGGPVAITRGLRTSASWTAGDFELSSNGTLVYPPGGRVGRKRRIVYVDGEGHVEPWSQERRAFEDGVSVSPDGAHLALVLVVRGLFEIWTSGVDRPRLRRLAGVLDADCYVPCWSPDAERLVYSRHGKNELDGIYQRRADGTDEPERLARPESPLTEELIPKSWSPDGSYLLVGRLVGGTPRDILLLPLEPDESGGRTLRPLLTESFNESEPDFSPDGRWISYGSDETGRNEVYVRAFRADATLGPSVPVTTSGGSEPIWSRDGKTIFYRSQEGMMTVEIALEPQVRVSQPQRAFDGVAVRDASDTGCSVMPDGRLVVIQKGEDEDEVTRVNVVLNWFDELKAKVPTGK